MNIEAFRKSVDENLSTKIEPKMNEKTGILMQIATLFLIGAILVGLFTGKTLYDNATKEAEDETEDRAWKICEEIRQSVGEFPAYDWLLSYWDTHSADLDIEYDVLFSDEGTRTEEKVKLLAEHQPEFLLRYAGQKEIEALPEEDQKLCAEITYSWLITRVNEIKRSNRVDYLFFVLSDNDFQTQEFLFSAADVYSKRGTNYEEVYPLGTTVTVGESQQSAMREAAENNEHLADAGEYVDYYQYTGEINGKPSFIGLTFNLSDIRHEVEKSTRNATMWAIVAELILLMACLNMVYFRVIRPLKKVQTGIRTYRDQKDTEMVQKTLSQIRSRNEIGDLSEDVLSLTREIDEYVHRISTISADKERIQTELEMASGIQSAMLPHSFPFREEYTVFGSMDPAREVGGDFFDVFRIDDDHLGLMIADVSGKGVPAALFMMISMTLLKNNTMARANPAEILHRTNRAICANNPQDMFVTVWMGILELSTGKLTAANAGHEYPAIRHADGSFELYHDRHGLVIGAIGGAKYTEYELQLEPGSAIFLYTDGVPEATASNKALFGTERMLEALNAHPDAEPEELLKNVRTAVDDFVQDAEQFDDLTMMCLKYKGKGQ